jgi:hypothetical protein
MSHIDDTRERLTKLSAHFGDKLLPRGTSVEKAILKLTPDAELGAKIRDKGRGGHELAHGTAGEKLQRWGEYQIEVDRLHELRPTRSYEDMVTRAAEKFGVSITTIKRHTDNPRKK